MISAILWIVGIGLGILGLMAFGVFLVGITGGPRS